ncbi:6393_t:CDS:2 [Funneliformis caledonium]|uniref:6393_t:CDS:1 n=1 Tax=Funneliformis caledonium TaxID=1117310 RepID=A0A9N9ASA6_9GLOM|nr:6393_t:CDS:2 [Funneliformis caledonium]
MRRTGSLQYVFPSFQVTINAQFQCKNARVYYDNDKYGVGLFTLSIYEEFSSKQKEEKEAQKEKVYEAKDIFTQTFGSYCKLDKQHLTTHRPSSCTTSLDGRVFQGNKHYVYRSVKKLDVTDDKFLGHSVLRTYVTNTFPKNISYLQFLNEIFPPYAKTWEGMKSSWSKRFLREINDLGKDVIEKSMGEIPPK